MQSLQKLSYIHDCAPNSDILGYSFKMRTVQNLFDSDYAALACPFVHSLRTQRCPQFWEVLDLSWGTAAAVPDVADAAATGDDGDALPDAIPNDAVHDHFGGVHDHSGWDHRDEFEHRAHHDGYDHAMEVVDDSQNDSQVLLEPEYGETDTTVDSPEPDAEAVTSETTNPSLSVAPCEDAPSADTAQPDKSPMLGEPNRAKTKDASAKIHALRCSVKEKIRIPMSKKTIKF